MDMQQFVFEYNVLSHVINILSYQKAIQSVTL